MLALDDWTRRSLQDALPEGAQFAWDGGMRVCIGWLARRATEPTFAPTIVLRFNRDLVAVIGQDLSRLSGLVVDRARCVVLSRLAFCETEPRPGPASPLVVELDLHSMGPD